MATQKMTDVQKWINVFRNKREDMLLSYPHTNVPEIRDFTEGFAKYVGQGHFMYVLVENYDEEKVLEIMNKPTPPKAMIKQLREVTQDLQAILLDAEMGEMSVW